MTEMLHGRMRNTAIRRIVADRASLWRSKVRVELGKGTAHSWATITTTAPIEESLREAITTELIERRLIGQYPDEMSDAMFPCVHFNVKRVAS